MDRPKRQISYIQIKHSLSNILNTDIITNYWAIRPSLCPSVRQNITLNRINHYW